MAKRNDPNPTLPSALDAAVEPGMSSPTSQSLNQSPGTPTGAPGQSGMNLTPEQIAGAQQQTAQDQTNAMASQSKPTPVADYTSYSNFNPTYSGDGGFNSTAPANSMDALQVYSGAKVPVAVQMDQRFGAQGASKTTTMNRYELVTGTTMMQRYMTMAENDPSSFKKLQDKLVAGGFGLTKKYANGEMNDQTVNALQTLLHTASRYQDPAMTPDATLQRAIDSSANTPDSTSTRTSYNFTNPLDATALANKASNSYLGQDATQPQAQQFYSALHAAQQANPAISTTNSSIDPTTGQVTSQATTDKSAGLGSAGADQLATDWAQAQPDYAQYQSTQLMDRMFKLLGGPV